MLWQADGALLAESSGSPKKVPVPEHAAAPEPRAPPGDDAGDGPMRPRLGPQMPPSGRTRGQYPGGLPRHAGGRGPPGRLLDLQDLKDMQRLALRLVAAGAGVLLSGWPGAGGWPRAPSGRSKTSAPRR